MKKLILPVSQLVAVMLLVLASNITFGAEVTPAITPFFTIKLPGVWHGGKTSDPTLWQYQSNSGNEQVSVSVFEYSKPPAQNQIKKYLKQYIDVRRKAEVNTAHSPALKITSTTIKVQGQVVTGTYSGYDPERSRRFMSFTVQNRKRIVTFYYEALDMTAKVFGKRMQKVLGQVKVAE